MPRRCEVNIEKGWRAEHSLRASNLSHKILRKLLGFSKQIESLRDNHVFSTQYCLDSALEQVKVLITVTCKAIDLHQQDWTPC